LAETLALCGGAPVRRRPWAPWPEHGEPERRALLRVLESRSWGGHPSPNTEARAFCADFAGYLGTRHAVACANGSVALVLALQAARVPPGSEVVVPVYTFVATAAAVAAAGCVPVFVDVEPESYCMDPAELEAALSPRTAAVIPVHLACSMADMDRIPALCEARGLLLLEDCAHAHGARWRGRAAGSIGALGGFSMQSTKLLTAGEGGAVATSDDLLAQRLHSLVNCGRKEPGYDAFPERMLGHNLRISEWQAAVLREQLRRLPEQHARRAANLERFEWEIAKVPGLRPLPRDPRVTAATAYQWILRYDARAFAGVHRDRVLEALRAEGVPCSGRFYVPLPQDPLWAADPLTNPAVRAGAASPTRSFPVAERAAFDEAIWLPHPLFLGGADDVDDLVAAFAKVQAGAAALREAPAAARGAAR
jgi:dTDP-4-amino-4,6-dideoxygalactose transaminase